MGEFFWIAEKAVAKKKTGNQNQLIEPCSSFWRKGRPRYVYRSIFKLNMYNISQLGLLLFFSFKRTPNPHVF